MSGVGGFISGLSNLGMQWYQTITGKPAVFVPAVNPSVAAATGYQPASSGISVQTVLLVLGAGILVFILLAQRKAG